MMGWKSLIAVGVLEWSLALSALAMPTEWIEWQGQQVEVVPGEMLMTRPRDQSIRISSGLSSAEFLQTIGTDEIYRVRVTPGLDTRQSLAAWSQDNPSIKIQPNFIYRLFKEEPPMNFWSQIISMPNWLSLHAFDESPGMPPQFDRMDSLRWDLEQMQVPEAHRLMTEKNLWKPETVVAVLDTGFYPEHPALKKMKDPYSVYAIFFYNGAKVYTSRNEYEPAVKGKRMNPETGQYEDYTVVGGWHDWVGHGTHCAGTIAGADISAKQFRGVAPGYTIMPVKILDDEGMGSSSQILQGVYYARDRGAKILSMSLGGPAADAVSERVYSDVEKAGMTVIAAAGNSFEQGNPIFYPAAYSSVLSVASLGSDGWMSYFSQAGDWVSVAAPGGDGHKRNRAGKQRQIFSTYTADPRAPGHQPRDPPEPGEDGKYYVGMSGTSMATPHVSGLVALLKSIRPGLTLQEIRGILQSTGQRPSGSFYPKQLSISPAVRTVNALAAIRKVLDGGSPGSPGEGVRDWSGLSWEPHAGFSKGEVQVEAIRVHFGFKEDWVWRPETGQNLDFSDPNIKNKSVLFKKSVPPGDADSTAYMDLILRVRGKVEYTHTVFFKRLNSTRPAVLFSWSLDSSDGRKKADLILDLEPSQKQYVVRAVLN